MPVDTFEDHLSSIEDWKDRAVITVCNSGKKSGEAADILVENGFKDVTNAEGVKDGSYNLVTWGNIRADELQEAVAAQALVDMGYTNVYNCLDGAKEVEYIFDK